MADFQMIIIRYKGRANNKIVTECIHARGSKIILNRGPRILVGCCDCVAQTITFTDGTGVTVRVGPESIPETHAIVVKLAIAFSKRLHHIQIGGQGVAAWAISRGQRIGPHHLFTVTIYITHTTTIITATQIGIYRMIIAYRIRVTDRI
jgi:hypothetical protein